jgi:hypothetical protein
MPLALKRCRINCVIASIMCGGDVMTCNVGGIERPIRIGVGILLLGIGVFANLPLVGTAIMLAAGTIALVTGVIQFCPLWALLGMNTCHTQTPRKL